MPGAIDRRKVLVVEDEALVAMDVCEMLVELGLEIVGPAARLPDALQLIDAHPDLAFAVMDMNLAGVRSWPAARALRGRGAPVLFLTGYIAAQSDLPDDLADVVICAKPVDLRSLADAIREAAGTLFPL